MTFMDIAVLRMLHVGPSSAALRLTVPIPLLAQFLTHVGELRSKETWDLDSVAVRREDQQRAAVTLRLATNRPDDCPRRRQALMGLVMSVLEHLRERWSKSTSTPSAESTSAAEDDAAPATMRSATSKPAEG